MIITMKVSKARLKQIINEELTRSDKTEIKKMIEKELEKLLKKKETKDQIADLTKKIMKKLYKDLSLEHPYIIDRIKV
jgi:LEA14-like dessication related protein